jgi:hypothetical protein
MGCSACREDVSEKEAAIINAEAQLKYKYIDLNEFINSLLSSSKGNQISESDFKVIAKKYKLALVNNPPDKKIANFYSEMSNGGFYDIRKLATIAVLLNNSKAEIKAKALFKVWTKNTAENINRRTGEQMFDVIFEYSAKDMTLLVSPSDEESKLWDLAEDAVKIALGSNVKDKLLEDLFRNSYSLNESAFVAWFEESANEKWLSSSRTRIELRKLGKNNEKKIEKQMNEIMDIPTPKETNS